jgi:hypothetical protein
MLLATSLGGSKTVSLVALLLRHPYDVDSAVLLQLSTEVTSTQSQTAAHLEASRAIYCALPTKDPPTKYQRQLPTHIHQDRVSNIVYPCHVDGHEAELERRAGALEMRVVVEGGVCKQRVGHHRVSVFAFTLPLLKGGSVWEGHVRLLVNAPVRVAIKGGVLVTGKGIAQAYHQSMDLRRRRTWLCRRREPHHERTQCWS